MRYLIWSTGLVLSLLSNLCLAENITCKEMLFRNFYIFSGKSNYVIYKNVPALGGGYALDLDATNGVYNDHFIYVVNTEQHLFNGIKTAYFMNYPVKIGIDGDEFKCTDRVLFANAITVEIPN